MYYKNQLLFPRDAGFYIPTNKRFIGLILNLNSIWPIKRLIRVDKRLVTRIFSPKIILKPTNIVGYI